MLILCLLPIVCFSQIMAPLTLKTGICEISEKKLTWTFTHKAIVVEDEKGGVSVLNVSDSFVTSDDEIALITTYTTNLGTITVMFDQGAKEFVYVFPSWNTEEFYPVIE